MSERIRDKNLTNDFNNTHTFSYPSPPVDENLDLSSLSLDDHHQNGLPQTPTSTTSRNTNDHINNQPPHNGFSKNSQLIATTSLQQTAPHGLLNDPIYLMSIAELAARKSDDPNTKVGACIVDAQHRIVGIGYNKFPPNYSDDPYTWEKCSTNKLKDKLTYVLHAEAVAIMDRSALNLHGATLYTTLLPCNECAKMIIQAGISQVYYLREKQKNEWIYDASRRMLDAARVTVIQLQKHE